MRAVEKPIIVVGTGRCGSTMLHRLLALHPDLGWTSTFNEVFPTQTWLSVFCNRSQCRWLSHRIKHLTCFPKPFEAYRFWEPYLPEFSRRHKPLTAANVPADRIDRVRNTVARLLHWQNKTRLL